MPPEEEMLDALAHFKSEQRPAPVVRPQQFHLIDPPQRDKTTALLWFVVVSLIGFAIVLGFLAVN